MGWRKPGVRGIALVFLILSSSLAISAPGQDDPGKSRLPADTPLPPVRPASLQPPQIPQQPAPAQPATPPAVTPATTASVAPDPPRPLPAASRARMHECGIDWQNMKATGAAADKTWRAFAQVCLVR